MRYSIKNILDRLKWHPDYSFEKVTVRFVDRPRGISEVSGEDIVDVGHKFIYTRTSAIPHHRVVEILHDGEVVWRRG
ncbi:DUF504 domain-containing protein [Geoglobus sp.]